MVMSPNLAYWTVAQTGQVVPLCSGIPGVGKTQMAEAFARATGRPCYTLIGSIREPGDVGGYPYLVDTKTAVKDPVTGAELDVFMQLVAPKWAMDCHDGQDWIVFIDELTTCPPAVQAALLRTIAEKMVGDLPLPKDTWILSACNPPGVAANGFELEPPMANRLCHLTWETDWKSWDKGMMAGGVFPEPQFSLLPHDWQRHLPDIGSRITGFRSRRPGLFEEYPDDRSKAGGAWPSPRSWHNAATCAAAVQAIGGDESLRYQVIRGCVGEAAAGQFGEWERSLDLPDPEALIQAGLKALGTKQLPELNLPERPDQVIVTLSSVSRLALDKLTVKRWEAAMVVFAVAAQHQPDVVVTCIQPMLETLPDGADINGDLVKRLYPLLKAGGLLP